MNLMASIVEAADYRKMEMSESFLFKVSHRLGYDRTLASWLSEELSNSRRMPKSQSRKGQNLILFHWYHCRGDFIRLYS